MFSLFSCISPLLEAERERERKREREKERERERERKGLMMRCRRTQ
jgi:hypothetical protein